LAWRCPGKKNKHMKKRKGRSTEPNPRNLPLERGALEVPTDPAALMDGPSYVKCVARQVDLVAISARLLLSTDEKIAKAELDRLCELTFGKGGPPPTDDVLRIDWTGMPRPDREPKKFDEE